MTFSDPAIQPLFELTSDKNSKLWDERTNGRAPHKPFLLLSIMDGVGQGWITDNRIVLSQDLIEAFFSYWGAVMGERTTTIALPYFHMNSEPFWKLSYRSGKKEFGYSPSLGGLQDRVEYAVLDEVLFSLMADPEKREEVRIRLADYYFTGDTVQAVLYTGSRNRTTFEYAEFIGSLAAEPFVPYQADEARIRKTTKYTQVREAGFSMRVRKNYENTCAICRDRVITQSGQIMVEGAHIIPWSESNNDDPRNGLSLCPTHHWMFDEYMMTIRPDYTIAFSGWLNHESNRVKELKEYKDKPILLPAERRFMPAREALEDHFMRFEDINN